MIKCVEEAIGPCPGPEPTEAALDRSVPHLWRLENGVLLEYPWKKGDNEADTNMPSEPTNTSSGLTKPTPEGIVTTDGEDNRPTAPPTPASSGEESAGEWELSSLESTVDSGTSSTGTESPLKTRIRLELYRESPTYSERDGGEEQLWVRTPLHPSAQQASRRQLRRATRAWLEAFLEPTGGDADEEMPALVADEQPNTKVTATEPDDEDESAQPPIFASWTKRWIGWSSNNDPSNWTSLTATRYPRRTKQKPYRRRTQRRCAATTAPAKQHQRASSGSSPHHFGATGWRRTACRALAAGTQWTSCGPENLRRKTRKHTHPTPRVCAGVSGWCKGEGGWDARPAPSGHKNFQPAINHVFWKVFRYRCGVTRLG